MSTEKVKGKRVKVNTPKGARYLSFAPAKNLSEELFICQSNCPYGMEVCKSLRHPEHPDDPDLSFLDFCSNLGSLKEDAAEYDPKVSDNFVGGSEDLIIYYPTEGTIERNLSDCDLGDAFQKLIADGYHVKLGKVIDTVCKNVCPMYNPEHSGCNMRSELCLLHDLARNE